MPPDRLNPSPLAAARQALRRIPGLRRAWRLVRPLVSKHARGLRAAERLAPGLLLQPDALTYYHRRPWLFAYLQEVLRDTENPRILSFGCSTGEEVFSLRDYFPEAELVGIDINPANIAACQRASERLGLTRDIRFVCAGSSEAEPDASYDAILCLAVMRHVGLQEAEPERCDEFIDFGVVEQLASDLARCLKPGGYLAIWNSHFRFADFSIADQFDVTLSNPKGTRLHVLLYGPGNQKLDVPGYCDAVFRKRPKNALPLP